MFFTKRNLKAVLFSMVAVFFSQLSHAGWSNPSFEDAVIEYLNSIQNPATLQDFLNEKDPILGNRKPLCTLITTVNRGMTTGHKSEKEAFTVFLNQNKDEVIFTSDHKTASFKLQIDRESALKESYFEIGDFFKKISIDENSVSPQVRIYFKISETNLGGPDTAFGYRFRVLSFLVRQNGHINGAGYCPYNLPL